MAKELYGAAKKAHEAKLARGPKVKKKPALAGAALRAHEAKLARGPKVKGISLNQALTQLGAKPGRSHKGTTHRLNLGKSQGGKVVQHKAYTYVNKAGKTIHVPAHVEHI